MNPISSPLDRPASIPVVRRLLATKALTPQEAETMEQLIRRELPWKLWLDRVLLILGLILILSGIGYFFAHNWNHLTDNDKLVLAGGAVLLSLIGATWSGLDRFPGKLLLLASCVLVGIFLAVFGQIYQTGADSYQLFTAWAFLIIPWVILGRFMPLWIFWLGLLNLALGFYWPVSPFYGAMESLDIFRQETISLFLLNGLALLVREGLTRWPIAWMDRGWSALILIAAALAPASVQTISEILHTWDAHTSSASAFLTCVLYAALVIGLGFYFSRQRYSLPALALTTLSTCIVLTFLAIRVINFDQPHLDAGMWLLTGIIILAIFGGGVFFLRTQRLSHHQE